MNLHKSPKDPSLHSLLWVNLIFPANFIPCTCMYVCLPSSDEQAFNKKSKALHLFLQKKEFYIVYGTCDGMDWWVSSTTFVFPFVYQFYTRIISFVDWTFWNHAELFISVSFQFGALLKTRGIFCLYLFWGKAKWQLNILLNYK